MEIDKNSVLKRLHRYQLDKYGISKDTYDKKYEKGYRPFLNAENNVEWLSRDDYSVFEVKKKKKHRSSSKGKSGKSKSEYVDFAQKIVFITVLMGILLATFFALRIIGFF